MFQFFIGETIVYDLTRRQLITTGATAMVGLAFLPNITFASEGNSNQILPKPNFRCSVMSSDGQLLLSKGSDIEASFAINSNEDSFF